MLFKDSYRRYQLTQVKRNASYDSLINEVNSGLILSTPSDSKYLNHYRGMKELSILLNKIEALSKTIDDIKKSVTDMALVTDNNDSVAKDQDYPKHLRDAFVQERNTLSIEANGAPFSEQQTPTHF